MKAQDDRLAENTLYYVTMDFNQPSSYCSVNNAVANRITPAATAYTCRDGMNHIVGFIYTGGDKTIGGWSDQQPCSFPRILVDIPDGPQYVTVSLYKSTGNAGDDLAQLAVLFELTPVDSGDRPELNI